MTDRGSNFRLFCDCKNFLFLFSFFLWRQQPFRPSWDLRPLACHTLVWKFSPVRETCPGHISTDTHTREPTAKKEGTPTISNMTERGGEDATWDERMLELSRRPNELSLQPQDLQVDPMLRWHLCRSEDRSGEARPLPSRQPLRSYYRVSAFP